MPDQTKIEKVGTRLFELAVRGLELLALSAFFCAADAVSDSWLLRILAIISIGLVGAYVGYLIFKSVESLHGESQRKSAISRVAWFAATLVCVWLSTQFGDAIVEIVKAQMR